MFSVTVHTLINAGKVYTYYWKKGVVISVCFHPNHRVYSWDGCCTNTLVPQDPNSAITSATISLWIQPRIAFPDGLILTVDLTQLVQVIWPEPILKGNKDPSSYLSDNKCKADWMTILYSSSTSISGCLWTQIGKPSLVQHQLISWRNCSSHAT